MQIIEIHRGSEAWNTIANAILVGHTLRIGEPTVSTVKIKINEGMWTPPLSTID